MTRRSIPTTTILGAGVGVGSAGDFLLRSSEGPLLGLPLLFTALAVSVVIVSFHGGPRLSPEAGSLVALGVLTATGLLWRGSDLLRLLAFIGAVSAFTLPALFAGRAWVRRAEIADFLEAIFASGGQAAFGSLRLFVQDGRHRARSEGSRETAEKAAQSALVGTLLATVPLAVFGALFISADRVFAGMVEDFIKIDLRSFTSHLMVVAILSWLACGYLVGLSSGTRMHRIRTAELPFRSLGTAEVAIALGLVDVLFLGFVLVQFRYLFGGTEWVEATPGLSYATYAREGFFQLLAATALGLPWLLLTDGLLRDREGPGRWVFRVLAGAQLLLLTGIVASAVQRMRAYLDAYGLTEDRFVAMTVLVWLALLVFWFGGTVLRGRRSLFAFGTLLSAYALVAFLHIVNPAAYSARSYLDHAAAGGPTASSTAGRLASDAAYLASLGSDATPILLERLDELDDVAQCTVARSLLFRWDPERVWDWRSWNAADRLARRLVDREAVRLRMMAGEGESCG